MSSLADAYPQLTEEERNAQQEVLEIGPEAFYKEYGEDSKEWKLFASASSKLCGACFCCFFIFEHLYVDCFVLDNSRNPNALFYAFLQRNTTVLP